MTFKNRNKLLRQNEGEESLEIHWLSIMNSLILVVLLIGFVAIILIRILHSDYSRYSKERTSEDEEDYGWKLVHGDVFRFPPFKSLLASFLGSGVQLLLVAFSIFALTLIGILYPEKRGSMYTAGIFIYAIASAVAGFVSNRFYTQIRGEKWAWNTVLTATLFAVPVALVALVANVVASLYRVTSGMPVTQMLEVAALWAFVGLPLTVLGGIAGRRLAGTFDAPVRTKNFPREIPVVPWYRQAGVQFLISGFLPFSGIYVELYYIYTSLWGHAVYDLRGILFLVFLILLAVTACITIALCYFQLAMEDYRWWWQSFINGGATGAFILGYSAFYYLYRSNMTGVVQAVKYFSYVSIFCYFFFIMLGTVGFFSALFFVRQIYKGLKID